MGLANNTLLPIENVTSSMNFSDPACMMISINHVIMSDVAMFVMLALLTLIITIAVNIRNENWPVSVMVSCAITGVIGIFMWLMRCDIDGTSVGLVTTWQMWILPVVAIMVGLFLWMTRK